MPRQTIPAPGYTRISGNRAPPKAWGDKLWVQIRNGFTDVSPWPVETTRWRWERDEAGNVIEHPGDVVAIKRVDG